MSCSFVIQIHRLGGATPDPRSSVHQVAEEVSWKVSSSYSGTPSNWRMLFLIDQIADDLHTAGTRFSSSRISWEPR